MIESQGLDTIKLPGFPNQPNTSSTVRNPWDYEVLPSAEFVGQVHYSDGGITMLVLDARS